MEREKERRRNRKEWSAGKKREGGREGEQEEEKRGETTPTSLCSLPQYNTTYSPGFIAA